MFVSHSKHTRLEILQHPPPPQPYLPKPLNLFDPHCFNPNKHDECSEPSMDDWLEKSWDSTLEEPY
jgi:hypothetical protein